MVIAIIAEAVVILALIAMLYRVVFYWMRSVNVQQGIPDVEKKPRTRIISPYKQKKNPMGGEGE